MTRSYFTRFLLTLPFLALSACSPETSTTVRPAKAPVADPENPSNPQVLITTSEGLIRAELFQDKSPLSTENFLKYVDAKHFDNTLFHRVIKDFMIQGGGFENQNGNYVEKPVNAPIRNEATNGLKNRRGTLAMARTPDPHSATSQFFINTVDNGEKLGPGGASPDGYAVFGKVLEGMEVVDRIRAVPTSKGMLTSLNNGQKLPGSHDDVPQKLMLIQSITRVAK